MRNVAAALALIALGGCKDLDPPPPAPFQLYVKVESDPGRAVQGASVSRGNKALAQTGADGRAMLTLGGNEGDVADIFIKCPETFQSPTKPIGVRLTRLSDKTRIPEYTTSCPPMLRKVVVAVKAENGPFLPVVYLNKAITRTDASGAAHFALEVAPGAQFNVVLDTAENSKLKPVSPSKPFTVGQTDDILVFEQKFDVEKVKTYVYRPNIPKALN
jgi:hypothetical protein